MAHQKLYEAEAEVEAKTLEKWNSEFASGEINQEFESQRVGGLITLKEIKLACMKNWNWEIVSSRKNMQENAKKLMNWEEFVVKKQIKQDMQEIKECLCNNRDLLRLWVRWLLKFRFFRTEWILWMMQENFYDPESGSSSSATHVLDSTPTVLNSRTLPRCDSGLPRNTQNCTGIMGIVFERPPAQQGRSSTVYSNSKNLASSSKELIEDWHNWDSKSAEKRIVEYVDSITSLPKQKWNVKSYWWNLFLTVVLLIIQELLLQNWILENFLTLWNFNAGSWTSELKFVCEQPILK